MINIFRRKVVEVTGFSSDMFKITKHFCDVAFLNKKMVEEYYENKEKD